MSLSRNQTERALEEIVRDVYSEGIKPPLGEITRRLSQYLSEHPAGTPMPFPEVPNGKSDPEQYNGMLRALGENVEVLYEVALEQIEQVMQLSSTLQSSLQRLSAHRRRVETVIDDYLLTLFDTDGYYYSASDTFTDTALTDLDMTSAQIDPIMGAVLLPSVTSMTRKIPKEYVSAPAITVRNGLTYRELSPFIGALEDNLDNMIWATEVEVTQPQEVVMIVRVNIGNADISRIDFTPYGVSPTQVFVETRNQDAVWRDFGGSIQTSSNKMSFGAPTENTTSVRFTLRKTQPDYTDSSSGQLRYRYIFGAKEISMFEQAYDFDATFVSVPLTLPEDLQDENIIDAVSLVVDEEIPSGTQLDYSVAVDYGTGSTNLTDYSWHTLNPIDSDDMGDKIVRFEGAAWERRNIYMGAQSPDLSLLPPNAIGAIATHNPNPSIIPGTDIWRLATFTEDILLNSVELYEGVNTTRIYSTTIDDDAMEGLQFWKDKIDQGGLTIDYGKVNTGAEFFYGGDVGVSNRSCYVETYLNSDRARDTFLAEVQKTDARSREWSIKIFLNGRELGFLPKGVHNMQLPWTLREGLNHIAIIANIPDSDAVSDTYTGAINLFGDTSVSEYGDIYLAQWHYTDLFNMQYNETGEPYTFTIHNGEIISRRKPTNNFLLRFARTTGNAPTAVRLRADMSRDINDNSVSPQLKSYRLRFLYGPEED